MATDSAGNVYVADTFNSTIRKITPVGVVTTLAGVAGAHGNADGMGGAARFDNPAGVATDSGGNVYVADSQNNTIRKITPAGVVTTLAGLFRGSADGVGSGAGFNFPSGVATDSDGNVYVSDYDSNTIRKITPAGVVTTLAGLAVNPGNSDGTGSAARFLNPSGLATDSEGNIYVTDTNNHTIRKITPAGAVTTVAGLAGSLGSADGMGNAVRFYNPRGVATHSSGNVYIADNSHTIRKMTPAGEVTTLAGLAGIFGSTDGMGSAARFRFPAGVAADLGGNIYVADLVNDTIRKITPAGVVTTLAGLAGVIGSADGMGSAARFSNPWGVATDNVGNVYVADTQNNTIRKITPAGVVTTLAGLAGATGSTDGTGNAARFLRPTGLATDSIGNVYVADYENDTIRKITPTGMVTTLAGLARFQGDADGMGSAARFYHPSGVATDGGGNVYVADSNHTIRKITPAGVVTTLAGLAGVIGSADGTGSVARFFNPWGVATDNIGNIYVTDSQNNTIRKITTSGVVTTVAGLAGPSLGIGSDDGTGSSARFFRPSGIATDSDGNVYVADFSNHVIRVGHISIPDLATIDSAVGIVGATRHLDAAPPTATRWQWSLIRKPAWSNAQLSSSTVRNPLFTPDVADLYTFRLVASDGKNSTISTVDLIVALPRRRAVRR